VTHGPDNPFHRLLATKYKREEEALGIEILDAHPELAMLEWPGPDEQGQPFVRGSTALHYAANDGKDALVARLLDLGADVNASNADWYRSVLAWAANNARLLTIGLLLDRGADPKSMDAMHAAAWGGSRCGEGYEQRYADALRLLVEAGADHNDKRYHDSTPLGFALQSGNRGAIDYLRSIGAAE